MSCYKFLTKTPHPITKLTIFLSAFSNWLKTWETEHFCHKLFLRGKDTWNADNILDLSMDATQK